MLIIIIIILGTQSIPSRVSSASTAEKIPNDHGPWHVRGRYEVYVSIWCVVAHESLQD